tara:strand:+ start:39 stop:1052 length:1014 start_codon:yes stop_codon:yes gene_type:complete
MDLNILKDLLSLDSPVEHEIETINYIKKLNWSNFILFEKLSSNKNFVLYKNNKSKKNILIDAHIDEICSRIHLITEEGFLIVKSIGTDERNLFGKPVKVISSVTDKKYKGVYLIDPPHFKKFREKNKDPINKNILYLDLGFKDKKEAEKKVRIGDHVLIDYPHFQINKATITGRGLDNKIGTSILINLLNYFNKHKSKFNLIFNFSSREEIGKTSYLNHNIFQIDEIIVLDTTFATDVPFIKNELYGDISLSKGPVLERGGANTNIYKKIIKIAKQNKIPYQNYLAYAGGSNLDLFAKFSCSSQFVGVPTRNIHSGVETANLKDIKNTFNLVKKYLE